MLWVVLELTTFSLVPLIFFYRSKESLEAVWKYLFLVSIGLVFLVRRHPVSRPLGARGR